MYHAVLNGAFLFASVIYTYIRKQYEYGGSMQNSQRFNEYIYFKEGMGGGLWPKMLIPIHFDYLSLNLIIFINFRF